MTTALTSAVISALYSAPVLAADQKIGQTPPALAWIHVNDSQGISMWNYELSLDRGGITNPGKFFWASLTDTCWGLYRAGVALALWLLDWVFSFTWVQTFAKPMMSTGDTMQQLVDRVGVVPTFLAITALVAGLWMFQGKYATTVWEVGISCVIAALATGIFAQPVQLIAGPDGYIVKANQTGQELAAELSTDRFHRSDPQEVSQLQIGQLVDTFIRQPTELINFGQTVDGTDCERFYTSVVRKGPYGNDDDIRKAVAECDKDLGEYAANPSASMAIGSLAFLPAAAVILLLALVLAGSMIVSSVWAMYQSVKLIVALVTGLLPGSSRGSLMLTIAETAMAMASIVFTSVFLSVFLLVISNFFDQAAAGPQTFIVVDIMIFAGIIVYWRQRQQFRAAARRLAEWMSQRPGARATRLPDQARNPLSSVATGIRTVAAVAQLRQHRSAGRGGGAGMGPVFIDNRRQAAMFFGMSGGDDGSQPATVSIAPSPLPPGAARAQLTAGPDTGAGPQGPDSPGGGPQSPSGPSGPRPRGGGGRGGMSGRVSAVRRGAGALLRAGAGTALAAATGGVAPTIAAVSRTRKAATTARRAAVVSRLSSAGRSAPGRSGRPPARPVRTRARTASAGTSPVPGPATGGGQRASRPSAGHRPQVIRGEVISARENRPAQPRRPGKTSGKTSGKSPASGQGRSPSAGSPATPRATGRTPRATQPPPGSGQPAQRRTRPARRPQRPQGN
jgi:hypothetical protein